MEYKLLQLTILFPLIGFIINGLIGSKLSKKMSGAIGIVSVAISFLCSIILYLKINEVGVLETNLFHWIQIANISIDFAFRVDALSSWMMLIITGIGTLIHIYSLGYMSEDEGFSRFFAYLNLFIFSMLILVMGSNFLMLFIGWEGVGLCSYLLIGFWYKNIDFGHAARKAFIMNRIGDLGLLIGIFLCIQHFGTIDFYEIQLFVSSGNYNTTTLSLITLCLFIGAMGKSAQIPLYTWLPDAMAGPTPVSALIHAATMVTAGIYLIVRNAGLFDLSPATTFFILIIGLTTSIFAAIIGLFQNDIKKILAYSTVSQLGLMFVAIGVGAYSSAMFHLTTHAFFKALLFLGAGSVIHAMSGEQNILKMGGLKASIKTTHITFLIGTLAIIGFPLFSGFFSKDEILGKLYMYSPWIWGLTLFSSILTIFYMLRLYFLTFWGTFKGTESQKSHLHESPKSMTIPLLILALFSLLGGIINLPSILSSSNGQYLAHRIASIPSLKSLHTYHEMGHSTEWMLMGIASILVLVLFCFIFLRLKSSNFEEKSMHPSKISIWGENKFYIDELYQWLFVTPMEALSDIINKYIEPNIISRISTSPGKVLFGMGNIMRYIQQGNVEYYLVYIAVGIIIFISIVFLQH